MLDYLRQGSQAEPLEAASQQEPTESTDTQPYIHVRDRGKNVHRTTCLFGLLFFIGLLLLWFMIKKSVPSSTQAAAVAAEQVQIETAMAKLSGVSAEMNTGIEQIVNKFYEISDFEQIKVDELIKDPFRLESFGRGSSRKGSDEFGLNLGLIIQQQLAEQVEKMVLITVMESGGVKCCMIDDELLYEGDRIKDFVVSRISVSEVVLRAEGFESILKMKE